MNSKFKLAIKRAPASKQPAYMLKLMSQLRTCLSDSYDKKDLPGVIGQIDNIIDSFRSDARKNVITGKIIQRRTYGENMDIYTLSGENRLATIYFEECGHCNHLANINL